MPAEAENSEVKGIEDEIIPVTHETEKEFIDVVGNHAEVETFTHDEVDIFISDCDGQFLQIIHKVHKIQNNFYSYICLPLLTPKIIF